MYKTFIATYKNAFGLLMTKEVFAKTIKQAISILFRYQKVESIYFVFLLGLAVILEGISIAFIFPIVQIIVSSETSPYLKFFESLL